jgi:preprotein translocase SecE subunit
MASITKSNDGTSAMADDQLPDEQDTAEDTKATAPIESQPRKAQRQAAGPSFFTIYKKGQGYWTRMGTVIGVVLIGAFMAYNLYEYIPTFLPEGVKPKTGTAIGFGTAVGFAIAYTIFCWKLMNKPTNVDFLIATDSEMKKVNWTSRRELIGSTKVVVIFMFLTALFLFVCDIVFIFIMRLLHVLKFGYFG